MNNSTILEYGSLNKLYSALIECFAVILAGYLVGCFGMIKSKYGEGIKVFVWNLCLPSMVLLGMWELNFAEVNWKFLTCILIAKVIVFCLVLTITFLTYRPINFGAAGIYGIFTTASNDFALGYPMLKALYGPDSLYLKYIYLFAPISLTFLNPIGFILMEVHNARTLKNLPQRRSKFMACLHILVDVIRNPIVIMTILGIACNLLFDQKVPGILKYILTELGNAFSATALFYLGLNLVGKAKSQHGFGLVVPCLLIFAKTLFLPLIIWEVVSAIQPGSTFNETQSFGMYGFLYGTFPTAPSVFIFASQYSVVENIIASSLVLCTILSAPLMFISAKMRTMMCHHSVDYTHFIHDTMFDISILSLIACVWVLAVLIISSRWKKMPHQLTLCLTISQMIGAVGVISFHLNNNSFIWSSRVEFALISIGNLSVICWTSLLSLVICVIRTRRRMDILRKSFPILLTGIGFPLILTGILFFFDWDNHLSVFDPAFQYGTIQASVHLFLTILSIMITVTSLVYSQRYVADQFPQSSPNRHLPRDNPSINNGFLTNSVAIDSDTENIPSLNESASTAGFSVNSPNNLVNVNQSDDDLNLRTELENSHATLQQLNECEAHLLNTEESDTLFANTDLTPNGLDTDTPFDNETSRQSQISKHLILIICLLFTVCMNFFISLWRVSGDTEKSGAYVEVVFLNCVLTNGQGFLLFLIFGLDAIFVIGPFVARFRRLRCISCCYALFTDTRNKENENLHKKCDQFTKYHKSNCQTEIAKDIRCSSNVYHSAFMGKTLCKWLINAGLAEDSDDSSDYGQKLLQGKIIKNVHCDSKNFSLGSLYIFS